MGEVGYTFKSNIGVNDNKCFAKEGNGKYFIRVGIDPGCIGQLLNPFAVNYNEGDEFKASSVSSGQRKYEWKKVSKECFLAYLKFLSNKSQIHVNHAQSIFDSK